MLSSTEMEALFVGRHFLVRTDQQSLRYILQQREVGANYQKWVSKLLGFDFEIQYKPRSANRVADALSRKTNGAVECGALVTTKWVSWEELAREIAADPTLNQIKTELRNGEKQLVGFHLVEDKLMYKSRYVIPEFTIHIPKILQAYHDSPVGGHTRDVKTYLRMVADWYGIGMRKDVADYVRKCVICQHQKASTQNPSGLLQPLPLPFMVWDDISMDFVEGLPKSRGVDTILVVVDRLSKYAHFLGLKHPFTALLVADLFIREVVRLHGFPSSILTDRDRIVMSHFWKEIFCLHGTKLKRSTSYHP